MFGLIGSIHMFGLFYPNLVEHSVSCSEDPNQTPLTTASVLFSYMYVR